MALSTLVRRLNAGKAVFPYFPFTFPESASEPVVFTVAKSLAYTAGTSDRMLLKSVLGAPKVRSRARSSPTDAAEPESATVRSLSRSPLCLRVTAFFTMSAAASTLRSTRT